MENGNEKEYGSSCSIKSSADLGSRTASISHQRKVSQQMKLGTGEVASKWAETRDATRQMPLQNALVDPSKSEHPSEMQETTPANRSTLPKCKKRPQQIGAPFPKCGKRPQQIGAPCRNAANDPSRSEHPSKMQETTTANLSTFSNCRKRP